MPLQTQSMSLTGFVCLFFMRARVSLTASQTTPKSKNWPSKQSVPNKSMHTSDSWVNFSHERVSVEPIKTAK